MSELEIQLLDGVVPNIVKTPESSKVEDEDPFIPRERGCYGMQDSRNTSMSMALPRSAFKHLQR